MRFLACLALLFVVSGLQAQGIEFTTESWAEITARAKTEHKFIFVDAVTEWCGPCKLMAEQVFPNEKVGTFFNDRFISVKLDIERDEDGQMLNELYRIRQLPTLLFFSPEGEPVHRVIGFHGAEGLLDQGHNALDPEQQYYRKKAQYEERKNNPDWLLNFMLASDKAGEGTKAAMADYMALTTKEDWVKPSHWMRIVQVRTSFESEMYRFAMQNEEKLRQICEPQQMDEFLDFPKTFFLMRNSVRDEADLEVVYTTIRDVMGEANAVGMIAEFDMIWHQNHSTEQAWQKKLDFMDRYCTDAEKFNTQAWNVVELEQATPEQLNKGMEWINKALASEQTYSFLDTKAWLFYRMGDEEKAAEWANRAVTSAEAEERDASSSLKLKHLLED